jgi:hypothetical protein
MEYPKSQNTWEPEENLVGVKELFEEFYKERELKAHAQRLITERKTTKKKREKERFFYLKAIPTSGTHTINSRLITQPFT